MPDAPVSATPAAAPTAETPATPSAPSTILSGAGTPATPSAAQPSTTATPSSFKLYGEDGKPNADFVNAFPEQYKGARAFFGKYANAEQAAKGLEELQYFAGQKTLTRPAADAPKDVQDAFAARLRAANGAPEKPEDYGIKAPEKMPEGMTWDDATAGEFGKLAYKYAANPEFVKEAIALQTGMVAKQIEAYQEQQAKALQEADSMLTKEFGDKRNQALSRTVQYAQSIGIDINDPAVGNNAKLIIALHKASQQIDESKFIPATHPSDAANVQQQISELGKKAIEAQTKGDMDAYKLFSGQQRDLIKVQSHNRR